MSWMPIDLGIRHGLGADHYKGEHGVLSVLNGSSPGANPFHFSDGRNSRLFPHPETTAGLSASGQTGREKNT